MATNVLSIYSKKMVKSMKFVKFSKSYKNVFACKRLLKMNSLNLKTVVKINKIFKTEKRTHCQNCLIKITKPFILNFGVKYSICNRCTP